MCECRLPVTIFVHKIQLYCIPTISRCTAIDKYNSLHNHVTATIYILSKYNYISPLSPRLYNMPEINTTLCEIVNIIKNVLIIYKTYLLFRRRVLVEQLKPMYTQIIINVIYLHKNVFKKYTNLNC